MTTQQEKIEIVNVNLKELKDNIYKDKHIISYIRETTIKYEKVGSEESFMKFLSERIIDLLIYWF